MVRIAVYGKGGIGKSTVSSNITAALSDMGIRVLQVGCDPKHDSTRLLGSCAEDNTVLDFLKKNSVGRLEDLVFPGYKGCLCVEAGGPEPGVGCAGRGIISAFDVLSDLGIDDVPIDVVLYDVLGDVVCGGFAVPLRNDYAEKVFIVTSGEFMSIYAANNILRGISNYDPDRVGGLIFNSRGEPEEYERVKRFSDAVDVPIVAMFDRLPCFLEAERMGKTVVEAFPGSDISDRFRDLARIILNGKCTHATYLSESELEKTVLGSSRVRRVSQACDIDIPSEHRKGFVPDRTNPYDVVHGCAFSGAASVCSSVEGLTTILHSPGSCAHFTFQLEANSVKRKFKWGILPTPAVLEPDVVCTDMKDDDLIFGGLGKLESVIREQSSLGKKDMVVITSCPAGIIGDDVENLIMRMERELDVRIALLSEDGNINGDFMKGVGDATVCLLDKFSVPTCDRKKNSVNIIGVKTLSTNCDENLALIKNMMNEAGVELNCTCIGNTSIDSIRHVSASDSGVMLNRDRFTLMLRKTLSERYGMGFLENTIRPGIAGTEDWLRELAEKHGDIAMAEKAIEGYREQFGKKADRLRPMLKGRSVYILSLQWDIDWITEIAEATGMDILRTVIVVRPTYTDEKETRNRYPYVEYHEDQDMSSIIQDIKNRRPDILLTSMDIPVDTCTVKCFMPCVPDIGPLSGPEFAETWVKTMYAPKEEGWRKDALRL